MGGETWPADFLIYKNGVCKTCRIQLMQWSGSNMHVLWSTLSSKSGEKVAAPNYLFPVHYTCMRYKSCFLNEKLQCQLVQQAVYISTKQQTKDIEDGINWIKQWGKYCICMQTPVTWLHYCQLTSARQSSARCNQRYVDTDIKLHLFEQRGYNCQREVILIFSIPYIMQHDVSRLRTIIFTLSECRRAVPLS